jgi:hypothetical protein
MQDSRFFLVTGLVCLYECFELQYDYLFTDSRTRNMLVLPPFVAKSLLVLDLSPSSGRLTFYLYSMYNLNLALVLIHFPTYLRSARFYAQSKALIHAFLLTPSARHRVRSFSKYCQFLAEFEHCRPSLNYPASPQRHFSIACSAK